jgi:hypothetical protein
VKQAMYPYLVSRCKMGGVTPLVLHMPSRNLVKKICRDMQRQNIHAKVYEKSSSALHSDINFMWGKR